MLRRRAVERCRDHERELPGRLGPDIAYLQVFVQKLGGETEEIPEHLSELSGFRVSLRLRLALVNHLHQGRHERLYLLEISDPETLHSSRVDIEPPVIVAGHIDDPGETADGSHLPVLIEVEHTEETVAGEYGGEHKPVALLEDVKRQLAPRKEYYLQGEDRDGQFSGAAAHEVIMDSAGVQKVNAWVYWKTMKYLWLTCRIPMALCLAIFACQPLQARHGFAASPPPVIAGHVPELPDTSEITDAIGEIESALPANKLDTELSALDAAIEKSPESAELLMRRGQLRVKKSKERSVSITDDARLSLLKGGLADMESARKLGIEPVAVCLNMGLAELTMGGFLHRTGAGEKEVNSHYKRARGYFQEILSKAGKVEGNPVKILISRTFVLEGKFQEALGMLDEDVETMSYAARREAYYVRAYALSKLGRADQSRAAIAEAEKLGLTMPTYDRALKDEPLGATGDKAAAIEKAFAPLIEKARAMLPSVKERFLLGLPRGERLFVTVKLSDCPGKYEQVFVQVLSWKGDNIRGRLDSDVQILKSYKRGYELDIPSTDVVDWTIVKPDGSEEGNLIGKYIDEMRAREEKK